jgi:hypothetical protein
MNKRLTEEEIEERLGVSGMTGVIFSHRLAYRSGYEDALKTVGEQGAELLTKFWNSTDTNLRKKIYDFFETLKRSEMPDEK